MTDALAKAITADDAARLLREKIKLAFAEIIPPEQWEELIRAEFQRFTEDREKQNQYGGGAIKIRSGLSEVAGEVIREIACEQIREYLVDGDHRIDLRKLMIARVEAEIPKVLTNMAVDLITKVASDVGQQLAFNLANRMGT